MGFKKKTSISFLSPEHELKPKQLKCNTSPPVVPHNRPCLHSGTGCIQNETHSTGLGKPVLWSSKITLISIFPTCLVAYVLNFPGKAICTLYKHRNVSSGRERCLHLWPSSASEEHRATGNSTEFSSLLYSQKTGESPSDSSDLHPWSAKQGWKEDSARTKMQVVPFAVFMGEKIPFLSLTPACPPTTHAALLMTGSIPAAMLFPRRVKEMQGRGSRVRTDCWFHQTDCSLPQSFLFWISSIILQPKIILKIIMLCYIFISQQENKSRFPTTSHTSLLIHLCLLIGCKGPELQKCFTFWKTDMSIGAGIIFFPFLSFPFLCTARWTRSHPILQRASVAHAPQCLLKPSCKLCIRHSLWLCWSWCLLLDIWRQKVLLKRQWWSFIILPYGHHISKIILSFLI